jgi:hypothetical protein
MLIKNYNTENCSCVYYLVGKRRLCIIIHATTSFFFFFAVLGFELRAFTLSHSTNPVIVCVMDFFKIGLANYLPRLALNRHPPDLCLLSS